MEVPSDAVGVIATVATELATLTAYVVVVVEAKVGIEPASGGKRHDEGWGTRRAGAR